MLDRIEFLLIEALTALRRNILMTFAAVTTAAISLFLLGGLAYVYLGVSRLASEVSNKFEMRVWMKDSVTEPQAMDAVRQIKAIKGVRLATLIPRDTAWAQMQRQQPELTKGWTKDILPHSIKVTIKELSDAAFVEGQLRRISTVDPNNIMYFRGEQQLMSQILAVLRWIGGLLGGLLLITTGILIFNAIKMTAISRRREVRIMLLVGASRFTVQAPFVLEGMIQGALGGALAAMLLMAAQAGVEKVVSAIMVGTAFPPFPIAWALSILMIMGALYGGLFSLLAIRDSLKAGMGVPQ